MTSTDYASLQARFTDAVIHNPVQFDPLWQCPCLAYNIHARPDRVCRDRLATVQEEFSRLGEPGLLGCPAGSLHVSVAPLLFVRRDHAEAKESLWAAHGSRWIADLTSFLETVQPFTLSYERVLVTDAAVLALADSSPALDAIGTSWLHSGRLTVSTTLNRPSSTPLCSGSVKGYGTRPGCWRAPSASASALGSRCKRSY